MSDATSKNESLEDWIDRATTAMVKASEEAHRLAEETGTEFIARPADKTACEPESKETLVVREGPED